MSEKLKAYAAAADAYSTVPTLTGMPRRSLADKGIAGPTAAHVIEEVHTPFNLAYLTFTTGSSAFQNIVGVAHTEIEARCEATARVMERIGARSGSRMLVTYPPLVNVFSKEALDRCGIEWFFLDRSSRGAFISAFCGQQPDIVLGESSFIRASITEAETLGLNDEFPKSCALVAAGTPLDLDLLGKASEHGWPVHDLYGCQEFGWLSIDGHPVRDDVMLSPTPSAPGWAELVVGGLPMGDSFPLVKSGHACSPDGHIITYRRRRTHPEYEVLVAATTTASRETIERAARTIMRIKGRVVKVLPDVVTGAQATELHLVPSLRESDERIVIRDPVHTRAFDDLVRAQVEMQASSKTDPAWTKTR